MVGAKGRVLDGSVGRGDPWGDRAESRDERAAEDSSALAHALRLVQRLGDMPLSHLEIDAARERVRQRVFAAIAAQSRKDGLMGRQDMRSPS